MAKHKTFFDFKMENSLYGKEDFESTALQKKKAWTIYWLVLSLYVLCSIGLVVFYTMLPWKSKYIITVKLIHYVITTIFIIFSFIYHTITLGRVRKYYKVLTGIEIGETVENVGTFIRYEESIEMKDRHDFRSIIIEQWSSKKQDFYERKILVDTEKDFPKFKLGENIKCYTHANILLGFDRLDETEGEDE